MDFPAKLLGSGAANSQGNGRLANTAGAEQSYESLISKLLANLTHDRFAPNHHDRSNREPALGGEFRVPAFRATSQRDDPADERIAPSLDVCDVSIAELAVTKRLADCGYVDPEASLLNGYVGPDVIHQLLLSDDRTWAVGKIGQNIQRPIPEGKHSIVAPKGPLANRKFKRAEPQLLVNYGAMHVCQPNVGSPRLGMRIAGRQPPQLCACKAGPNEARSLSLTFGKHELHLGITQSSSTWSWAVSPRRCDHNDRQEQHAPARPSRAARLVNEACCTMISRQIMDKSGLLSLRCRRELSYIANGQRRRPVAC